MAALELIAVLALGLSAGVESTGISWERVESAPAPELGELSRRLLETEAVEDPVQRAMLRATIFFEARDFAAVLAEVDAGLEHDPLALELLWRASASELWLQDGERALSWINKLREAAEQSGVDPDVQSSWLDVAQEFETQALAMRKLEQSGDAALGRAQLVAGIVALGGVLCVLLLVAPSRGSL